jgi:molybdate transport system regulatory protein
MPKSMKEGLDRSQGVRKCGYRVSIRIYLSSGLRLGSGKNASLEAIDETGSISAAARLLNMPDKRAWDLLEEMNGSLKKRVIVTSIGDDHGGGAELSRFGIELIKLYRIFGKDACAIGREHLRGIVRMERDAR